MCPVGVKPNLGFAAGSVLRSITSIRSMNFIRSIPPRILNGKRPPSGGRFVFRDLSDAVAAT